MTAEETKDGRPGGLPMNEAVPSSPAVGIPDALSHDAAIKALCDCAATVTLLSYREVVEGYFVLRGIPLP